MNTKEVCRKLSTTPKALRIYEQQNIVVPKRNKNNYRVYNTDDLLRLREVLLLKELGFSLKEIKSLTDKNIYVDNRFARSLYLQLRAIEGKINELDNIKDTLKDSIDTMLESNEKLNYDHFLNNISVILDENKSNRRHWIDEWDFNNKAVRFDNLVRDSSNDELGLFTNYDEILEEVRGRITKYEAKTILDIGCGTGNLCGGLSNRFDVVGMDQSIEMLLQAKKKYSTMKLKLGNFLDKPFSKGRFDIVVTTYAFHALNNNEKLIALGNMMEYLRESGKLIIVDFMFANDRERNECKNRLLNDAKETLWKAISNRYYTNIENLKSYAISKGYKVHCEHIVNFTWVVEIER